MHAQRGRQEFQAARRQAEKEAGGGGSRHVSGLDNETLGGSGFSFLLCGCSQLLPSPIQQTVTRCIFQIDNEPLIWNDMAQSFYEETHCHNQSASIKPSVKENMFSL